jgi:hypothetical protein
MRNLDNNSAKDIFLAILVILLLAFFLNPFHWILTRGIQTVIILLFAICFLLFIAFVWRENYADEREALHTKLAGRMAFLIGSCMLAIGAIIQSFEGKLDYWLLTTFGVMVLAKTVTIVYARMHK